MADSNEYERKIQEMRKYIPFLENLIKKMKNNKDDKREGHLNKVEMLYGLLTNKDKKLKLETLQKCEAVLVKLCKKIEKSDSALPDALNSPSTYFGSARQEQSKDKDDLPGAPASPSNTDGVFEFHNPIVIPTERRHTPPPPSNETLKNYRMEREGNRLFNRSRERHDDYNDRNTSAGSSGKHSPELFRRRSPKRDRPSQYDEELRKKYENPVANRPDAQPTTSYSHYVTPKQRVKTVRNSFSSEVLKSPPLTLDDLKDLMNDSEFQPTHRTSGPQHIHTTPLSNTFGAPGLQPVPLPVPPPPVPPPTIAPIPVLVSGSAVTPRLIPRSNQGKDTRYEQRSDPQNFAHPNNTNHVNNTNTNHVNPVRDPRNVNRTDPRFNRDSNVAPLVDHPRADHVDPKPVEQSVRLAFKYNPHPRREAIPTKPIDFEQHNQHVPRIEDNRSVNHLPSVNPSDPRLRNRQLPMFPPDSPIGNLPSPINSMPSPMSPMANFGDPKLNHPMAENRGSPNYGGPSKPFFGNYQQQAPMQRMSQPMIQANPMFMNHAPNRFKPQPPPQPRTYGEYRKFKQSVEMSHKKPTNEPKTDQSRFGTNHSPLEGTVKPMEFTNESAAPNVLDSMYRNTNYKKDPASNVQNFKIPKIRKEPIETTATSASNKDDSEDADNTNKRKEKTDQGNNSSKSNAESIANAQKSKTNESENGSDQENWDSIDTKSSSNANTNGKKISCDDDSESNGSNEDAMDWENTDEDCKSSNSSQEKTAKGKMETVTKKNTTQSPKKKPAPNTPPKADPKKKVFRKKIKAIEPNIEEDETETTNEEEHNVENARKRKNDTQPTEIPKKLVKADAVSASSVESANSEEHKQQTKPESSTATKNELQDENKEDGTETDVPDTIINSDISSKNIIEGKRRSRGSTRFTQDFEITPRKTKPPSTTSPKNDNVSDIKPTEDNSQECAISSTTTTTEPIASEEPIVGKKPARGKAKVFDQSKTTPQNQEVCTEENTKETPEAEASTSSGIATKQKDEITKEWLEGFLLNLFNPSNMTSNSVLTMLEKVLDANKFEQVKKILCGGDETKPNEEHTATAVTENLVMETALVSDEKDTSKVRPKKKKTELDRLNEDIRDMFICQGVLTATGRRMCSAISEKEHEIDPSVGKSDFTTGSTQPVTTKTSTSKAAPKSKAITPKAATKRKTRRGGCFWRGNRRRKKGGRPRQNYPTEGDTEPENEFNEGELDEDDDIPLSERLNRKRVDASESEAEEELLKIVVGGDKVIQCKSIGIKDATDEDKHGSKKEEIKFSPSDNKVEADAKISTDEACPSTKIQRSEDAAEITHLNVNEIGNLMPIVLLKRGRGRPPKSKSENVDTSRLTNTHSEMHSQSNYATTCALCDYSGRHMSNHYIHAHPESEVLISRLPPQTQDRLLVNIGNTPTEALRKVPHKTIYVHTCSFCEIKNAFTRVGWVDHFATHTGEYAFKCSKCCRMWNFSSEIKKHIAKKCPKAKPIRLRPVLGLGKYVHAYICKLCNYVQMQMDHVINHLESQHNCFDDANIIETILLDCSNVPFADSTALEATPSAKQHTLTNANGSSGETSGMTNAEKNLEVFVANEQNDINLDTNIIQFMRDVSFSATDSPPRQSMSVADRINERLKNAFTHATGEHLRNENSDTQKPKSMADRLSERFSRTPTKIDQPGTIVSGNDSKVTASDTVLESKVDTEESVVNPETTTYKEENTTAIETIYTTSTVDPKTMGVSIKKIGKNQESDDDVIIISDCEDETNSKKTTQSEKPGREGSSKGNNTANIVDGGDILDDDDDWEDIETPPSPSCLDSDSKGSAPENKMKKNKRIYATLSRLYASIVQPKSKDKPNTSKDSDSDSGDADKKEDNVDRKKLESNGMRRINKLGFSRRPPNALKYHCLVDGCSFLYSDIPEGLKNHVVFEHPGLTWDGFCHICNRQVNKAENIKLSGELDHMQQVHINKPTGTTTLSQEKISELQDVNNSNILSSGQLKIRRLPGDTLSVQALTQGKAQSPPRLQIASAVSLNKASDIWKPVNMPTTPDQHTGNKPIVIKGTQMSPGGSIVIQHKKSPGHSHLKIAKVTSIAELKMVPIATIGQSKLAASTRKDDPQNEENFPVKNMTKILLKPWTVSVSRKSEIVAKILLKYENLYAQYKCMGNECDFATHGSEKFMNHLVCHAKSRSLQVIETWLECSYCDMWAPNESKLIAHITAEHGKNIYQCAYCFYRSCEVSNVAMHQLDYHFGKETQILQCLGEPRQRLTEFEAVIQNIPCFVEAIKCADCPSTFLSPTEFIAHTNLHNSANSNQFICARCSPPENVIAKNFATAHLQIHGIYFYQCVNCKFGAGERVEFLRHMANRHPSNLLFCCMRTGKNESQINENVVARTDLGASFVSLSKGIEGQCLIRCPYTELELNSLGNEIAVDVSTESNQEAGQSSANASIATITEHASSSKESSSPISETVAKLNIENLDSSTESLPAIPTESTLPDNLDRPAKILNAAKEIVSATGPSLDLLYKCGFADCGYVVGNVKSFRLHLTQRHSLNQQTAQYYPCYYCGTQCKGLLEISNHYLQHERHRYFCFLCFETGRTATSLAMHISKTHLIKGKSTIVTYSLIKGSFNAKKDFFFVCPNSVKAAEVVRFGDRLLKMWERKKWTQMKKSFDVNEMDQLPRQAIFFEELFCAVCQYKTKVRTNLYRHLQFHKNEINVANVDPINPVPCLNSSEKHFDKMTNLACSSHANKPPPSAANGSGTPTGAAVATVGKPNSIVGNLRRVEHVAPEYVDTANRYVCGVTDCNHLTLTEAALKQHLSVVHWNETKYICPHCKVVICANKICPDKVIHHLKFHDTNLFQCRRCGYLHFLRPIMEKHLSEKHPNDNATYFIYNRKKDSVKKTTSIPRCLPENVETIDTPPKKDTVPGKKPVTQFLKWQCTLCKTKAATQNEMTTHINTVHNVKYRYQCSKCNFGGVLISQISDHANRKHPTGSTEVICFYVKADDEFIDQATKSTDTTPLWRRDPNKVKNIRGILMEDEPEPQLTSAIILPAAVDTVPDDEESLAETENSGIIEEPQVDSLQDEKDPNIVVESTANKNSSDLTPSTSDLRSNVAESPITDKDSDSPTYLNKLFKYVCYHCRTMYKTVAEFEQHWQQVHKPIPKDKLGMDRDHKEGRTPWFTVWRRVQCSRCTMTDDYREIAIHHYLEHPTNPFSVRDVDNEKKCGHCDFIYAKDISELNEHYQEQHPLVSEDICASPIPPAPSTVLSQNCLFELMLVGSSLQYVKCNICHAILNDMQVCTLHCSSLHKITGNVPCTVMQGMLFKCPTCQFCSPLEENVVKHIFNKIRNGNFTLHNSVTKPSKLSDDVWPFTMHEVIFPNGFVIEKYRLLGTQFGKLDVIEDFMQKRLIASNATTTIINSSEGSRDSTEFDENFKGTQSKRRPGKKSSSKQANDDSLESDEDWQPTVPKKKFKSAKAAAVGTAASSKQSVEQKIVETTSVSAVGNAETGNSNITEPYSFYGRRPVALDLGNIIANIIVDGVKVMIPAKDFRNIFKKDITLKLQKVNVKANVSASSFSTRNQRKAVIDASPSPMDIDDSTPMSKDGAEPKPK